MNEATRRGAYEKIESDSTSPRVDVQTRMKGLNQIQLRQEAAREGTEPDSTSSCGDMQRLTKGLNQIQPRHESTCRRPRRG